MVVGKYFIIDTGWSKKMAQKDVNKVSIVPIEKLSPSSLQPRTQFDAEKIKELAKSISSHGVLQPIIVRKRLSGGFEIVAGERRYRAAKLAKLKRVPCIMMDLVDEQALAVALVENVQRQDLNPIEEANAYLRLRETLKLSQEEIAAQIGKDRTTVTNILRLLRLPEVVQVMVVNESLSMGHARALLSLDSGDMIAMVAKKIVREGLSVRRVEALIRAIKGGYQTAEAKALIKENLKTQDPLQKELRLKLERALGTRVELRKEPPGYALIIHFDGPEQLNGLLDSLGVDL